MADEKQASLRISQAEERCASMDFEELVDEVEQRLGIADGRQDGLMALAQLVFENKPLIQVILLEIKRRYGRMEDARISERCELEDLKRQTEVLRACLDQEKQNAMPAVEEAFRWKEKWEEAIEMERKSQQDLKSSRREAETRFEELERLKEELSELKVQLTTTVDPTGEKLEESVKQCKFLEEENQKLEKKLARVTFELRSSSQIQSDGKSLAKQDSHSRSVECANRTPRFNLQGEHVEETEASDARQNNEHEREESSPSTLPSFEGIPQQGMCSIENRSRSNNMNSSSSADVAESREEEMAAESEYCSVYQACSFVAAGSECQPEYKEEIAETHDPEPERACLEQLEVLTRMTSALQGDIAAMKSNIMASFSTDDSNWPANLSPMSDTAAEQCMAETWADNHWKDLYLAIFSAHQELLNVNCMITEAAKAKECDTMVTSIAETKEAEAVATPRKESTNSPRDLITSLGMAYNPDGGDIFQYREPEEADPSVQEKMCVELRDCLVADLQQTLDVPCSSLRLCAVETAIAFLKGEVIAVDEKQLDLIRTIINTFSSPGDREHAFKVAFVKLKAIVVEISGEQRSGGNWSISEQVIQDIAHSKEKRQRILSYLLHLVVAWECMDVEARKRILMASEFLANAHWLVLLGRVSARGIGLNIRIPARAMRSSVSSREKRWTWIPQFRTRR